MHELYLAECIAKQTLSSLPLSVNGNRVSDIRVQIGELDAVVTETLTFMFDTVKQEHDLLKSANLHIDIERVLCKCRMCGTEFSIVEPVFICPICGATSVRVTRGRGIILTEITIDEKS